jgi:hypothetical protein
VADLRALSEWTGPPGALVLWLPTPATVASAQRAAASPIPPSYEQEQHLRTYRACQLRQQEMVRLLVVTWRVAGRCDIPAMTEVINAHLRRHDTYHSAFRFQDDRVVRHVIEDPASLELVPTEIGTVSAAEWRDAVAGTPGPLAWDCFRLGVVQHEHHFTFFGSIDHLHGDGSLIPILFHEIHHDYRALVEGVPRGRRRPAARYLDYCVRQRQEAAALSLSDTAVADWVDFLHHNHGRLPRFQMPLGDAGASGPVEQLTFEVLDPAEVLRFKSACTAAGARMLGGLLGCAALTEREVIGSTTYSVLTPVTTRKTPEEYRANGWFVGVLPVSIDVNDGAFSSAARAAQRCFDQRGHLADVPVDTVLQLASHLPTIDLTPGWGVMLSYLDAYLPPLNARWAKEWFESSGTVYLNPGVAGQVSLWFCRMAPGLSLTVAYPANATARASVARYVDTLIRTCRSVADSASVMPVAAD